MLLTFTLVLLIVFTVSVIIYLWFEKDILNLRVEFLEQKLFEFSQRLNKLEKDAVKITFEPQNEKVVIHPKVTIKPKKEMVLGEWQVKNGTPSIKSNKK